MEGWVSHATAKWLAAAALQLAAPVAQAAEPANNVRCIYDALTVEEREISLILILEDTDKSMTSKRSAAIHDELDRIIGDAEGRCVTRFKWLAGQAGNARAFAVSGLMRDTVGQTLRALKQDPAVIDGWFEANKARLGSSGTLATTDREDLRRKLTAAGWTSGGGRDSLGGAMLYADLLLGQQRLAANFARNRFYR